MSLRTELLAIVDDCRDVTGSAQLDQRNSRLTIRTRVWSEDKIGRGFATDTDLVIPQRYKIVQATARTVERLLGSGGTYSPGQHVLVGGITPAWYAPDGITKLGGFTSDELAPKGAPGKEILYLITGALVGQYSLTGVFVTRPYRIELLLQRMNATP